MLCYASAVRQRDARLGMHDPGSYEQMARSLITRHAARHKWAGRVLAAYIPRFYGMRIEDVFAYTVTEDDTRLAIARTAGWPIWSVLIERSTAERELRGREWEVTPCQRAWRAIEAADLSALQTVVEAHSSLLRPEPHDTAQGGSLLGAALHQERTRGHDAMRPIITWLVAQGQNEQYELKMQLCGHMYMKMDDVRYLLERGPDPRWVAPNGLPVLENAILRYWNGEAVDVIASRTVPRNALWIAAGLGDVDGVRRFLDRDGKPTRAARTFRPPLDSVGVMSVPMLPDPDDEEVLMEAFLVAVLNARLSVIEYMVQRGFDVDTRMWGGTPVVNMAVGNGWTPVVECLGRCGADLDIHEGNSNGTARDLARAMRENGTHGPRYRRIVELCGLDPDAILAARDATPRPAPIIAEALRDALAGDDAYRQGQSDVRAENLLFGLLRFGKLPLMSFTQVSDMDREQFHTAVLDRVQRGTERVAHDPLPLHADAQGALEAATALAVQRRRNDVNGLQLLWALLQAEQSVAVELLVRFGGDVAKLRESLARLAS